MENQKRITLEASTAGPLFMLSSALLFTATNIIIKLLDADYNVWHIGFFRFFGGTLVLIAVFGKKSNPSKGKNIPLLILRGCTGSVAFISLITAIRLLPVSTAMVIFYTFPAFSAVASFIIFREKIGVFQLVCMFIAISGVGVLLDFELGASMKGQIFGLIAGVFAGLTVTLIQSLRKTNGPVIIYLFFSMTGAMVTFPMFISNPIIPASAIEWAMICGLVFCTVFAQLLMNQGFFYCKGWEGGVFMSSEVIFTAIVGIIFLNDPVSWRFWAGGLMILGSVVALNRLSSEKAKES